MLWLRSSAVGGGRWAEGVWVWVWGVGAGKGERGWMRRGAAHVRAQEARLLPPLPVYRATPPPDTRRGLAVAPAALFDRLEATNARADEHAEALLVDLVQVDPRVRDRVLRRGHGVVSVPVVPAPRRWSA